MSFSQSFLIFSTASTLAFLWSAVFGKNKFALLASVSWLITLSWASYRGLFGPLRPPGSPLSFAAGTLILWFAVALLSKSFREALLQANPTLLISAQAYRAAFGFILLSAGLSDGSLERFSIPFAWAEIAVGALALPVARLVREGDPTARQLSWLWHAFGILGALNGLRRILWMSGTGGEAFMSVPWVWVPLFWVPTALFLHSLSLLKSRVRPDKEPS